MVKGRNVGPVSPQVVYAASVDLSQPTGPGVNEREFLVCLQDMTPAVCVVIPRGGRAVLPSVYDAVWLPPRGKNPFSVLWHEACLCLGVLRALRRRERPVLICRWGVFSVGLLAAAFATRAPIMVKTLGGPYLGGAPGESRPKAWLRRLLREADEALLRTFLRRVRMVDACTPELSDRAVRLGMPKSKVFTVPNATNTDRFRPQSTSECREQLGIPFDKVVGYVGGRPFERGASQALELLPRLSSLFPGVGLVVVGWDEQMEGARTRAAELNVSENCRFVGLRPYEEVASWINTFDVGVALDIPERSVEVGNSYQKVRQYLACGVPVVATRGGGLPLDAERIGTEVDPGDSEQLLRAVRHWLEIDEAERESTAVRASSFACENLSIKATTEVRRKLWTQHASRAGLDRR